MFWLALNTTARPRVEPEAQCKLDRALIEPDRVSVIHAYTRPLEQENVDIPRGGFTTSFRTSDALRP